MRCKGSTTGVVHPLCTGNPSRARPAQALCRGDAGTWRSRGGGQQHQTALVSPMLLAEGQPRHAAWPEWG